MEFVHHAINHALHAKEVEELIVNQEAVHHTIIIMIRHIGHHAICAVAIVEIAHHIQHAQAAMTAFIWMELHVNHVINHAKHVVDLMFATLVLMDFTRIHYKNALHALLTVNIVMKTLAQNAWTDIFLEQMANAQPNAILHA